MLPRPSGRRKRIGHVAAAAQAVSRGHCSAVRRPHRPLQSARMSTMIHGIPESFSPHPGER
jgi:hypothetical protein